MNVTRVIRTLTIGFLMAAVLLVGLAPVAYGSVPMPGDEVELDGNITEIKYREDGSVSAIVIAGHTVYLDMDTRVDGMLAVGAMAEVKALVRENGSLLALRIRVDEEVEIVGTITEVALMPDGTGKIFVDGTKVIITEDTDVDEGILAVGTMVEVDAIPHGLGKVIAIEIESDADDSVLPFVP